MTLPSLPISSVLADIGSLLRHHDELVLEAPPGAGKTTLVPLSLLGEPWLKQQKIIVLEPRRVAARAAAERMAQLLGEKAGERVGYRMRQDNCVGASTQIIVMTEGVLTRSLQEDPALEDVGIILFDEFHERNIQSDFGLALSLEARTLFRDEQNPLKIVAMSATLNGQSVAKLLNDAPIVRSEGRSYPVEVISGSALPVSASITNPVVDVVLQAIEQDEGSILVFLPGRKEIQEVERALNARIERNAVLKPNEHILDVLPLHGSLTLASQRKAIAAPKSPQHRHIILATDIAETSLTIEGVRVVVDSGLRRAPVFDTNTGISRLNTERISLASSVQRAGRAGRVQSGKCYQLWNSSVTLMEHSPPEIMQSDLAVLVLQSYDWGVDNLKDLKWMDLPPDAAIRQAMGLLQRLSAITWNGGEGDPSPPLETDASEINYAQWRLTEHGQELAKLPVEPRLAHMLVVACRYGIESLASQLAALLTEPARAGSLGNDIADHVSFINGEVTCPQSLKGWLERVKRQAKTFLRLCRAVSVKKKEGKEGIGGKGGLDRGDLIGFLLACAFPDRIAQKRDKASNTYKLSLGRMAQLDDDTLAQSEWLVAIDVGGLTGKSYDKIFLASALNAELFGDLLSDLVQVTTFTDWDSKQNRFVAEKRSNIGSLLLSCDSIANVPNELRARAFEKLIHDRGLSLMSWDKHTHQWRSRVRLIGELQSELMLAGEWPDLSDEGLLSLLNVWFTPFIDGVSTLEGLQKLNLKTMLETLLDWNQQQQLERLAPTHLRVPSGSNIQIDYSQSPPVLAVKLQEMFGYEKTPSIANGKVALMVHLLSPAGRPLQITQDLSGFWRTSYQEVKKEMKGRYPKHPWPDNPLEAIATRRTKKNMK